MSDHQDEITATGDCSVEESYFRTGTLPDQTHNQLYLLHPLAFYSRLLSLTLLPVLLLRGDLPVSSSWILAFQAAFLLVTALPFFLSSADISKPTWFQKAGIAEAIRKAGGFSHQSFRNKKAPLYLQYGSIFLFVAVLSIFVLERVGILFNTVFVWGPLYTAALVLDISRVILLRNMFEELKEKYTEEI